LGLNTACTEQLELEKRFTTNEFVELENCKLAFKVKQLGSEYTLTIEQIMAFYLTKLKRHFEKADISTKEIVLTIPTYCSNVERQSLLDAAEIAGLKCLRVINESTAIAY